MHEPHAPISPVNVTDITRALAAPFEVSEVRFKPAVVSGNRALALAYVDARVIQDRLDDVLSVEGWQDDYECLPDGSVVCRLRLKLGDDWVTKVDVGSPSEQPDGGDRLKAAFSDALKRAAVKFGIGRYLYRLPSQWADYDPQKRQFVRTPTLPAFAIPKPPEAARAVREEPPRQPAAEHDVVRDESARPAGAKPGTPEKPAESVPDRSKAKPAKGNDHAQPAAEHKLPADGTELHRRLTEYDAKLAAQGLCEKNALLQFVADAGVRAGFGADLTAWPEPGFVLAAEQTRKFEAELRRPKARRKDVA